MGLSILPICSARPHGLLSHHLFGSLRLKIPPGGERSGYEEEVGGEAARGTDMSDSMLLPLETYEEHKVHIGALQKSADMKPFLSDSTGDGTGLHMINLEHTDARMRVVAQFLTTDTTPVEFLSSVPDSTGSAPLVSLLRQLVPCTLLGDLFPAH